MTSLDHFDVLSADQFALRTIGKNEVLDTAVVCEGTLLLALLEPFVFATRDGACASDAKERDEGGSHEQR